MHRKWGDYKVQNVTINMSGQNGVVLGCINPRGQKRDQMHVNEKGCSSHLRCSSLSKKVGDGQLGRQYKTEMENWRDCGDTARYSNEKDSFKEEI